MHPRRGFADQFDTCLLAGARPVAQSGASHRCRLSGGGSGVHGGKPWTTGREATVVSSEEPEQHDEIMSVAQILPTPLIVLQSFRLYRHIGTPMSNPQSVALVGPNPRPGQHGERQLG